jgi:putative NADH-flavin reductase
MTRHPLGHPCIAQGGAPRSPSLIELLSPFSVSPARNGEDVEPSRPAQEPQRSRSSTPPRSTPLKLKTKNKTDAAASGRAAARLTSSARRATPAAAAAASARRPRLAPRAAAAPAAAPASYELDPDNASILVCGGGGVALAVTRRLKDMGSWVWMLQRTDVRKKEIEAMMAIVARGDALEPSDVARAFEQIEDVDAVVSSVGGTVADPRADGEGNINLIAAAAKKGVKKFVLVTSVGCGDSKDAPGEKVYAALAPVLREKDRAEAALREAAAQHGMAFTIVRPGGLLSEPPTGKGALTEDTGVCGSIARDDVAALVIRALFSKGADGKTLTAVDGGKVTTTHGSDGFKRFEC